MHRLQVSYFFDHQGNMLVVDNKPKLVKCGEGERQGQNKSNPKEICNDGLANKSGTKQPFHQGEPVTVNGWGSFGAIEGIYIRHGVGFGVVLIRNKTTIGFVGSDLDKHRRS